VTLKVNGEVVAEGTVPIGARSAFTANHCFDIGIRARFTGVAFLPSELEIGSLKCGHEPRTGLKVVQDAEASNENTA